MLIAELMTSTVHSVSSDTSIKEAASMMRDLDIGSLAVIDNGELCGILTDRDICCRCVADDLDPYKAEVSDIMTIDVTSCFGDQDISDAAELMEQMHIRRLAVKNHDDSIAGLFLLDSRRYCGRWDVTILGWLCII